ncbi:hypothetical protein BDF19DRAFT_477025 [Syncephalis fuscata]|nr:hypothetical protein BDF19DRAFT_477025 [Syncephalis fuscata]
MKRQKYSDKTIKAALFQNIIKPAAHLKQQFAFEKSKNSSDYQPICDMIKLIFDSYPPNYKFLSKSIYYNSKPCSKKHTNAYH